MALYRLGYSDPFVQAVHGRNYDQSFIQGGFGRGRGINRTERTPLEIYIYGNTPVPLACVGRWRDVKPDRLTRMVARGRGGS